MQKTIVTLINGRNTSAMSAWTDILARRNGRWQLVAEHGSSFN